MTGPGPGSGSGSGSGSGPGAGAGPSAGPSTDEERRAAGMRTRREVLGDAEIAEVLQHVAVYAGVPAANHGFAVARPILAELRGLRA